MGRENNKVRYLIEDRQKDIDMIKIRTAEYYMEMVRADGRDIEKVPYERRTPEICTAAVEQNGFALAYVPKHLKTHEMCMTAVKQIGFAIKYVPNAVLTAEMCMAAVKQNGYAFEYVSSWRGDMVDYELCYEAVSQSGILLAAVDFDQRTPELCTAAVKQNRKAIEHVPCNHRQEVLAVVGDAA
jgi:hypothetical protein